MRVEVHPSRWAPERRAAFNEWAHAHRIWGTFRTFVHPLGIQVYHYAEDEAGYEALLHGPLRGIPPWLDFTATTVKGPLPDWAVDGNWPVVPIPIEVTK
jgi:hypothetical protein